MKSNISKSNIKSINEINREITSAKRSGKNINGVSDGCYTFEEYIETRNNLFVALCNAYPDISWKSKNSSSSGAYNSDFIAGINAPDGVIVFNLNMKYWDELNVIEYDNISRCDGYSAEDVKVRLKSLKR